MVNATEEPKETAQSHTPRTPPLSAALESFNTDATSQAEAEDATTPVPDATEDGGLDLTMKKKKKKKVPKEGEEGEEAPAGEDGALDLTMKKKKKKKTVAKEGEDEFAAKLKALDLEGKEAEAAEGAGEADEGDMDAGTGIWQHDETKALSYSLLLDRFFHQLSQKNPDHALSGAKSYKIPPPQCMREGNKKTIFANIAEICKRMKRTEEHVTAYLFAELGTSGSVADGRRLVIKGRFQQKQLENVLRKYISKIISVFAPFPSSTRLLTNSFPSPAVEYVTCKTCKSADTELSKGENRLYFITCNSCGSRRSVTAIKTGFSAQVGKRKKMLK
ncbi:eukaryotic translation initiation factor 2 beta subunit [Colletotrichum karsti]|uniref:Eukaryotic translation initiation factor 2 beta subunit n=1 Tax=Colletotrichum karsti TaxID=1095194 RepID=A0A9P6LQE1_9PEZI|nr:eukaryotic translation initiation factor 2 beta subunit [Colletotrichum karsti]KAF9882090.1 eukaryotic translation initiation factor 2 beta subunit [Colletotrichum karsti]